MEILKTQDETSLMLNESFKSLAQKVCMLFATEGVHRKPYLQGLPHFEVLSLEKKQEIVRSLTFFKELCEEQVSEGYKLRDNSTFVWRAFRKLGYVPRSDVFNYLTDDNLVEIYSADNKQLYRNFKFFECCTYTLEELYSLEWWHLYERDPQETMKTFEICSKLFSGEITESFVPGLGPHFLKEINSSEKRECFMEIQLISPLKRNKQTEAIVLVETVKGLWN